MATTMVTKLLAPLVPLAAATAAALLSVSTAYAACPFNVAGGASADSLRDGVLLVRYARGIRGAALVAGTTANSSTVETNISANVDKLDLNGNGVFDIDDAAIISRSVFGFGSPAWLPDGRAGPYATRTLTPQLKAFVDSGCTSPVVSPPTAAQFEAARFLIQSTFGASRADVASFLAQPGASHAARAAQWISTQTGMSRPTKHFQYLQTRKTEFDAVAANFYDEMSRESFWGQALTSPDQLRQRLAFALSEILVVSSNGSSDNPFELAAYLDVLADNAFTNYRNILYKVAMSPAMGRYLSHLKNDGSSANPNENFAREVLQLFGVGLYMLGPDGEKLLTVGQPIATYDESTVKGFARVFTGLSYDDPYCKLIAVSPCTDGYGDPHPSWNWTPDNPYLGANFPPEIGGWKREMVPFPGRHSALSKQLLTYTDPSGPVGAICVNAALPGNQLLPPIDTTGSGVASRTKVNETQAYATINKAIDNIFCHPNVGPFLSKSLIRFFVTSTPTPAYVARVAAAFNNTGGVRGDMQAVISAVLLDPEAMQTGVTPPMNYGKLKEPILRLTGIFRAFNTASASGRYQLWYGLDDVDSGLSQGPLQSPTVFNYFHPEFSPPGPVSSALAIAPEFEITTTTAIAATQNYYGSLVAANDSGNNNAFNTNLIGRYGCDMNLIGSANPTTASRQHCLLGDLSELFALSAQYPLPSTDANAIFDYINLVLFAGSLSSINRDYLAGQLDLAFPRLPTPVLPATGPTSAYNTLVSNWQVRKRDRVKSALWLAVHLPEFQIQR